MALARQFLEATDVAAVADTLERMDERLTVIEKGQVAMTAQLVRDSDDHAEKLDAVLGAVDRSAGLERARDEANARLTEVMQQLPGRVAKKIQDR